MWSVETREVAAVTLNGRSLDNLPILTHIPLRVPFSLVMQREVDEPADAVFAILRACPSTKL